jgi:hypothetical protein
MLGTTATCLGMHRCLNQFALPAVVGEARWRTKMDAASRHLFVHDAVSSFLLSPILVALYALAALELGPLGVRARWEGTTAASRAGLAMHVGLNLYDLFYAYPLDKAKSWVYYAHHVAVLTCLLPVLFLERLHFFAMCTALIEATNPLVGACQNIDRAKVIGDPDLKGKGQGWATAQLGLGALLLGSWFAVRLCGLPVVVAAFVWDWPRYFAPGFRPASSPLVAVTRLLAAASITAAGFIWLLSCMWFVEMAQLARAALRLGGKDVLAQGK